MRLSDFGGDRGFSGVLDSIHLLLESALMLRSPRPMDFGGDAYEADSEPRTTSM